MAKEEEYGSQTAVKRRWFPAFWEVAMLELKEDMQYKISFGITIIIQPIIMLINIALFTSLYAHNGTSQIKGYDLSQMIWYFNGVSFIWIIIFNFTDRRLCEKILSGDLTMDLLRPISILKYELATSVGLRLAGLVNELAPAIVVYCLIYFPSFMTPLSILRFTVSIVLSFFLMYWLNFLVGLSAFIFKSNTAMMQIKGILLTFLGGASIPLDFYPPVVGAVLDYLPFKYIFYWPTQFLLNMKATQDIKVFLRVCLLQIIWIAIMYLASRFFWKKATKHFCAVG